MSLLLPTDLELNTCGMLGTERDEWFRASLNIPALNSGHWAMPPCYVFGWGETALPQYQLVTPLKSHGKTWPWTAQLSAAEAKVKVCTVVKADSKLAQAALLQGNVWHILVSTPNLLHLTQSLMNHCHSINTCESAKVNGIRPRIEQCGMLQCGILHPRFYTHPRIILSYLSNSNSPSYALMLPLTYPLCTQASCSVRSHQTEL